MKTLISVAFVLIIAIGFAQEAEESCFIGFQPSVTREKFYDENEFDVNVIPFVFQIGMSKQIDFRLITLANYHFGNSAQFSDVGIELATPVFWKKKGSIRAKSKGFFLSPVLGLSYNRMNEHITISTIAEAGYLFLIGEKLSLSASLQYGKSFYYYHSGTTKNMEHFGVKINIGLWL